MKVLFVSSGNSNEGISPIIKNQGNSLISLGISLDYFTVTGKGLKNYIKGIFILKNYLLKNRYDIIHAHYGLSAIVALIARRKEKIVVSFMGDDLLGSRNSVGKITFFSKLLSLVNKNLSKHNYDAIIVKSEEMLCQFVKSSKFFLIPNGVNLTEFLPVNRELAYEKTCWDSGRKHVVFISDPKREEKNYSLASASVVELDDPTIELHIVNNIPNSQLVFLYSAADCIILTSFHEGSPNVIKEAMACNCPIVSTDVGDVKWLLDGIEGCYITSNDQNDVADKIRKALDFKGKTRGREKLISLGLDSEHIAKRIIKVYEEVIL